MALACLFQMNMRCLGRCFEAQCGEQVKAGEDWFPCYLQCWNKARACVTLCAESFWSLYSTCSRHCLDLAATDTRQCRQACIVTEFTAVRNKLVFTWMPAVVELYCVLKAVGIWSVQLPGSLDDGGRGGPGSCGNGGED